MVGTVTTCEVKVELAKDGTICVAARVRGETHVCERSLSGPAEALDWLERRLDSYRGGPMHLFVRKPDGDEARWISQSSSLALMWLATVLGDAWRPGFRVTARTDDPHASGTRMRTGRLVLSPEVATPDAADKPDREDVA